MQLFLKNGIFASVSILNLINDLLDMAKIEQNTFAINYSQVNIIEIITQAFQITQFQADSKKIKLVLEVERNKPFILRKVQTDGRRIL
jgi:signal transduction histidine kinase